MFHALVIIGSSALARLQKAEKLAGFAFKPNPDLLVLESATSLGIAQTKSIAKFLSKKPYQQGTNVIFIPQADTLTIPAQNALLKTLEEPPPQTLIILACPNLNKLLPTVISRCRVITVQSESKQNTDVTAAQLQLTLKLIASSMGERLALAQTTAADSKSSQQFVVEQLQFLQTQLTASHAPTVAKLLKSHLNAFRQLQANVNPKLVMENLFLSYPKSLKIAKIN